MRENGERNEEEGKKKKKGRYLHYFPSLIETSERGKIEIFRDAWGTDLYKGQVVRGANAHVTPVS